MAAKSRDAQAGWYIYRSSGYSLSIEEVNEKLTAMGFNPIAPRTFQHYRKLHRYGYQRYVPINQLDVETLRDAVWGGALQSRYRPRTADLTVQILVVVDDDVVLLEGELIQLSDAEGSARVDLSASSIESKPTSIEDMHALVMLATETRAAVIELVQPDPGDQGRVTMRFLFLGFVPTSQYTGAVPLGPAHAVFKITSEEQGSPVVILRSLYALFEVLDSARLVCDQVLEALDLADEFTFSPTTVNSLSVSSPLLADLSLGGAPLILVASIVSAYAYLRKKYYESSIPKGQAEILSAQADIYREHARSLKIKNDRDELSSYLEVKGVVAFIVDVVKKGLPSEKRDSAPELTPEGLQRVAELVEKQLLPDAENLFNAPTEAVDVETDQEVPPLVDEDSEETPGENEDN